MCLMEISDTGSFSAKKGNWGDFVTRLLVLSLPLSAGVAQDYLQEIFAILGASTCEDTSLPQAHQHGCATEIHVAQMCNCSVFRRTVYPLYSPMKCDLYMYRGTRAMRTSRNVVSQ